MMSAPHDPQRYDSARWASGLHRKFTMFSEPPPSLATKCNALPKLPLAALFEGAAFTQARGPQNCRNNTVRTKFVMRDLPQPPPPTSSIRIILLAGSRCFGFPCFSHATCISFAMSDTGDRSSWLSVVASTRRVAKATGPNAARSVGMLC